MSQSPFHIVITGPESSGKSTLWNHLKQLVDAQFVDEVARKYLDDNGLDYQRQDLQQIAFLQFQKQLEALNANNELVISDTCLLTIVIWEEEKYGSVDIFTEEWFHLQKVDHYLLLKPDIPWVEDPQRENKDDRDRLYDIYLEKIRKSKIPFTVLEGSKEQRFKDAIKVCHTLINHL